MSSEKLNAALGLDHNLVPVNVPSKTNTATNHFSANFEPQLPHGTTRIVADQFRYGSLTEDSTSVVGWTGSGATFQQLTLIMSRGLSDGIYDLKLPHEGEVTVVIAYNGVLMNSYTGTVSFTRDSISHAIKGKADFRIRSGGGEEHHVKDFKFDLVATDPL